MTVYSDYRKEYFERNSSEKIIKKDIYTKDEESNYELSILNLFEYDVKGNLKKEQETYFPDNIIRQFDYDYDSRGNRIYEKFINTDTTGASIRNKTETYKKFDEKDKWVLQDV